MRIAIRTAREPGQAGSGPPDFDKPTIGTLVYESAGGAAAESAVCLLASIADAVCDATADACELAADCAEAEARCRAIKGGTPEADVLQRQAATARIFLGGKDHSYRIEIWLEPESDDAAPVKLGTLLGADVRGLLRDPLARLAGQMIKGATAEGRAILAELARPTDAPGEAAETRWGVLGLPAPAAAAPDADIDPEADPDDIDLALLEAPPQAPVKGARKR